MASLIAIITFLIVLNVQRSMLIPGGILGMGIWLLYYILKGPTNVIVATFIAAIVGSCISQILSIISDACRGLYVVHSRTLGSWIYFLSDHFLLCQWPISPGSDQCYPGGYSGLGDLHRDG